MSARFEKPPVLLQVPLTGHVVIEASAGTGKTYTLEHLIVDLLLRTPLRIEDLLVVTFTEKATDELKERIRRILARLLDVEKSDVNPISPAGESTDRFWVLDGDARRKLRAALLSIDSATISTIHAFCHGVLVENAFAHKRLLSQAQVDGRTAFAEAFADALRTEFARDPGLAAWLRAKWIRMDDLERLLADCARNRARIRPAWDADRLRRSLAPFADPGLRTAVEKDARTYGTRANKVAAIGRRLESLQRIATSAATSSDAVLLVDLDEAGIGYLSSDVIGVLGPRQTATRDALVALKAAVCPVEAATAQAYLPSVLDRVERGKRDRGEFDFDDMLRLVRESLFDPISGEAITAVLRKRYRVALIDEFQDTDEVQWDIFRRIFFESRDGHRLIVIGDPKQAIYRFRGADVATYMAARDEIVGSGGGQVRLTENHRSTVGIISACNQLFDQRSLYFEGGVAYDAPVTCGKPALALQDAEGRPLVPVKVLHVVSTGRDARNALRPVIAAEIAKILRDEPLYVHDGKEKRRVLAKNIFCLTGSDREGRDLAVDLRAAGIPVSFYKQDGLFQTDQARYVQRLLEAVDDPDDREKRQRAWLTPFFDVELKDLEGLEDVPATHPLAARLRDWHQTARRRQFDRLFGQILRESGVARREMFRAESERALTNYLHLFEVLEEEAHRSRMALSDLLRLLRGYIDGREEISGDEGNVQRLETDRDAVQIMTMHKAKGLEADVVFIAGGFRSPPTNVKVHAYHDASGARCIWVGRAGDADPDARGRFEAEKRQDNQRLLYVAVTRAKARLYLPYFGSPLPGDQFKGSVVPSKISGSWYEPIHMRLDNLVGRNGRAGSSADIAGAAPEFERVLIQRAVIPEAPSVPAGAAGIWDPPEAAVAPEPADASFDAIVRDRPGVLVTSYSRLAHDAHERIEVEKAEFNAEAQPEAPELGADELPPGSLTGSYLHELIELMPLEAMREGASFERWRRDALVGEILQSTALRFGFDERQSELAARLVFSTLTTPLKLPDGGTLASFSHARPLLREMEFLYPIPEDLHPRLERAGPDPVKWTVGRGFIKGFIDVLFEHEGRAYFGDWKSDSLVTWDSAALAGEVQRKYDIQVKLYSLALVKMLGVTSREAYEARVGGYAYLFLRGLTPGRTGREWSLVARPSWSEILEWEGELRRWDFGEPFRPSA